MSSTIILSSPEGPKELLMTFAIACVAKTASYQLSKPMKAPRDLFFRHTILLSDIRTSDFLPTQDCVRDWSVSLHRSSGRSGSQRVSAFRGASKMPAMANTRENKEKGGFSRAMVELGRLGVEWPLNLPHQGGGH